MLSQTPPTCDPNAISITWYSATVIRVVVWNVSNATAVKFPIWSTRNDQDDIVWADAQDYGGGWWVADHIPPTNETGEYNVHMYMVNASYPLVGCSAHTTQRPPPQCSAISTGWYSGGRRLRVFINGVGNADAVNVAVWSTPGWQDDLYWTVEPNPISLNYGNGNWIADILPSTYENNTEYNVHVYMNNANTQNQFCSATTTNRVIVNPEPQCATNAMSCFDNSRLAAFSGFTTQRRSKASALVAKLFVSNILTGTHPNSQSNLPISRGG